MVENHCIALYILIGKGYTFVVSAKAI